MKNHKIDIRECLQIMYAYPHYPWFKENQLIQENLKRPSPSSFAYENQIFINKGRSHYEKPLLIIQENPKEKLS